MLSFLSVRSKSLSVRALPFTLTLTRPMSLRPAQDMHPLPYRDLNGLPEKLVMGMRSTAGGSAGGGSAGSVCSLNIYHAALLGLTGFYTAVERERLSPSSSSLGGEASP